MNAPFRIKPFGFDQVFEAGGGAPADLDLATLRLRVMALEAELAARDDDRRQHISSAREAAFEAGMAQANTDRQNAILAATDAIHAAIESVEAEMQGFADAAAREAGEVARLAAELLAARMIEEAPAAAIDEAIGRVLGQVARGQEIQVAVHPSLAGELERLVAIRQSGDRRRLAIVVVADPACALPDAHISWDRGGLILDAAARRAAVDAAFAPVFAAG